MRRFAVLIAETDGFPVFHVSGELDSAGLPDLEAQLLEFLGTSTWAIIDLLGVAYMESLVIALLIDAHRQMASRPGGMALVCRKDTIGRLLTTAGLVERLDVCWSVADAVARLDSLRSDAANAADEP
jgi:anti-anti-sigma factor